jgi:gluconate:H+ symporter, GntP family
MHSNTALLLYTFIAVAGLVLLIVRFKLSAFLALIIASVFVGLCTGMEPLDLLDSFQKGVGSVLSSIAIIIGLGTILGKIIGQAGGAEAIASRLLSSFGVHRLSWAFLFMGLIVGLPVFFAVGLVLLVPILFAASREHRWPLLKAGLPMVAGLSAAHGLIPPHPGPLAAIQIIGADLAKTLLYSIPVALVSAIAAGPILVRFLTERTLTPEGSVASIPAASSRGASFGLSLAAILLPILLMCSSSITSVVIEKTSLLGRTFALVGHPVIALLIGILFAYFTLARQAGFNKEQILHYSEDSLGPVAVIILVVGAGAGFSRVLLDSGVGKAVADIAADWRLPILPMGFALAALVRIATGSATVAITTCAGLIKPVAEAQPGTNLELLVLAMGAGSIILSHVNDGGFWLVKGYLNLSVPQTFRTWTVLQTVLALVAFACVLIMQKLL